jgi:hypothetical protein
MRHTQHTVHTKWKCNSGDGLSLRGVNARQFQIANAQVSTAISTTGPPAAASCIPLWLWTNEFVLGAEWRDAEAKVAGRWALGDELGPMAHVVYALV